MKPVNLKESMTPQNDPAMPGLRERKKNKTRKIIQSEALRLFRLHEYEATTISQIAEVVEISESTFFRYFPTKVDIVRWDEFDPLIIESFLAQPAGLTAVVALRKAFGGVLNGLSAEERADLHERVMLALSFPHAMGTENLNGPMKSLTKVVAERAGRSPDDLGVHVLVGAVMGAALAALLAVADKPDADIVILLDEAMAYLEAGFSI